MAGKVFITGAAGFIGFQLAKRMLSDGWDVMGFDGMTPYYSPKLKEARLSILQSHAGFSFEKGMIEEEGRLTELVATFQPDIIIHLAAQAGVRHSIDAPRSYVVSNLIGTHEVLEAARAYPPKHLMMASTSSAYGANTEMPYSEQHRAVHPMSFYAATKVANEAMAHSYAHLFDMPMTMFRFFTVYGPWGRPDMALFKFTKGIFEGTPIDIYNHGDMHRDFTYVEDLVRGIRLLMDAVPVRPDSPDDIAPGDSLSPVAPWRVVNIGNSNTVKLLDFVDAIEDVLGIPAQRNLMEMQKGDVPATWADATLLHDLTGYKPQTDVRDGIAQFVAWYRNYYKV